MTQPDPRRWKALAVLSLVQFMLVVDVTVVNVALPHIQVDLGFSRPGLTWVVDGYTLMAGGLLLLGGRLGDLLGRRRLFLIGVGIFAAASAVSGFSVSPGMLIASRFGQGLGEALAAPAAFGLVALLFPHGSERAKAIGIFGGIAGLGGTLGPIISGVLISVISWRGIFFVNVPVALFALVAVVQLVDESQAAAQLDAQVDGRRRPERPGAGKRPDIAGAVLATSGLVGIVYGLITAANHSWGSASVITSLAGGAVLLVGFVLRERRAADPLVPPSFMRNRTRVTANVATLFFASAFFTVFFLMTLYWEQVHGYSALQTGLAYLPVGVFIGLGIAVASSAVTRVGYKPLLVSGALIGGAGIGLLARITPHGSYWTQPLPALVLMGVGAGFSFAAFGNASMDRVSEQDASLASGIQSTVQQAGGAVGLAALATIALRYADDHVRHGMDFATATTNGTKLAVLVAGLVSLGSGIVVAVALRGGPAGEGPAAFSRSPEETEPVPNPTR